MWIEFRRAMRRAGWLVPATVIAANSSGARADAKPAKLPELHVAGTHVADNRNHRVRLRGVNTASLEWSSNGEGHILDTVRTAIGTGTSTSSACRSRRTAGSARRPNRPTRGRPTAPSCKQVVDLCAGKGCYVMLDLHW